MGVKIEYYEQLVPFEEMLYGFKYGAATITRLFSDKKRGWVVIELKTPKVNLQLYVTKTGKVRITDSSHVEWMPR